MEGKGRERVEESRRGGQNGLGGGMAGGDGVVYDWGCRQGARVVEGLGGAG